MAWSSRPQAHGRRGRGGGARRRWLLTYADMITLLMALFMVLFSIPSVNVSEFVTLQRSLQDAFSGRILSGPRVEERRRRTTSAQLSLLGHTEQLDGRP